MEEQKLKEFKEYIRGSPKPMLRLYRDILTEELKRPAIDLMIDFELLTNALMELYPFIYSKNRNSNKVAHRVGIAIFLHEISHRYGNMTMTNIGKSILRDRTNMYHYMKLAERINFPGYESNKDAYDGVKKNLMDRINNGEFDKIN